MVLTSHRELTQFFLFSSWPKPKQLPKDLAAHQQWIMTKQPTRLCYKYFRKDGEFQPTTVSKFIVLGHICDCPWWVPWWLRYMITGPKWRCCLSPTWESRYCDSVANTEPGDIPSLVPVFSPFKSQLGPRNKCWLDNNSKLIFFLKQKCSLNMQICNALLCCCCCFSV